MRTTPSPERHSISGTARWRRCAIGFGLLALAGCIGPGVFPGAPLARYAPIPRGEHGSVSASGEVGYVTGGGSSAFAFPVGAASLTLALGHRYDLSISANAGSTVLEGNLLLVDGPVRLGLLHGAGFGLSVDNNNDITTIDYQVRAGLFLGEPGRSHVVAALGWIYAGGASGSAILGTSGAGSSPVNGGFHSLYLSIGYPSHTHGLTVTPELMLLKSFANPDIGQSDLFGVAGSVTLTAPF